MPVFGKIVVIKRNGTDGTYFPLTANSCLFGRKKECDIRIQLPQVSKEHCKIEVNENKEAVLFNLSSANPTQLNGNHFQDPTHLKHGDILTIIDRSFRFEYSPPSLPQKRISRSQEKETLQILQVQHMQQMDLLHMQNSDYQNSLTGKKLETCSPTRSEKRLQKQYSAPEFKYKMQRTEKANELSPFSKLYELMKREDGTDNVKENTRNETLLEDVFHSRSRRFTVSRAKLTKIEHSEDSNIQEKSGIVTNPIPVFEEKNSKKSSSTQNCDIQHKQECEGTNQSDFHDIEDNEMGKDQIIRSANKNAHFKANQQSAQHFPESHCTVSMDYTKKATCLNKFNLTDAFTSVENTMPKAKSSRESIQNYSSPCSRNSRRSSKSRRSWVEIDSLNKMKSSGEMEECPVQVSGQEHESGILIGSIYSNKNENGELVTETALNLKDSEDGSSSMVYSSLHFNTSKSCNNNIELNKNISSEYSCTEAIDKVSFIPADLPQTSEIMTNQIPERTLETECPTNENKIGIKDHERNVNMKNDIPIFSGSYESSVQTSAEVNAGFEMNLLCPLNKKSEAKKSPQKRRSKELDFLVQTLGKRKRVSFGGQLSPELFDKRLPPNSPLKKGAIPARLSMPYGNSPRAALKKVADLRQSAIQGSFQRKQYENIVPKQAASQCVSDPHVARLSSEGEETTTQEMHVNSLSSEVKQTVSNTTSLRRSKTCTPRRSSIRGKSGAMDNVHSKRRSGASEANLMVAKSWAEVVKQGVPKLQLKSASKQGFKTRSVRNVASKSSKNNNLAKTPKRKISGHFSTGHANSPAPIVIGKAHTGILNITAQVPKVVINYPLKQHCDLNDSFTGLTEMFCSPSNAEQNSFVPETQISRPEMNASEESEKKSVLDVKISSQKIAYNPDVISPALEEVSQVSIRDNLMISPNERNIMGVEERNLQQESEPVAQLLEIKRLLKTSKEKSEPVEVLSGVNRLLRTPKQKSEPVEALSAVKRLLKTPKEKSESVEALSGIKRLLRTPKQKSAPAEVLSGVKRLLRTPKEKSEPAEALSEGRRLLRTPEEKSEPVEDLSGLKRLFKTPKEKSEPAEALSGGKRLLRTPEEKSKPVEELSAVKGLFKTPKEKSEPVEDLSGLKRFFKTPKEKSEPAEALSGGKRLLRIPEEKSEPVEDLSGLKRLFKTPKEKSEPAEALSGGKRLLRTPKQKSKPVEELSGVKGLFKTPKEKSEPVEDLSGLKRLFKTPKEKSEPAEALSGGKRLLRTPEEKSKPVEELSGVKGLFKTPKEKSEPVEDLSGLKRLFKTPKEKSEPAEALSGGKRLLRTPEEKSKPVEELSAVKGLFKTPKEKSEPVEDLSGLKRLFKTPKEKSEPAEALSGGKRLLRTPKQKSKPVEELSGVKGLFKTPKEKSEPAEALSGLKRLLETPEQKSEPVEVFSEIKTLLKTPRQTMGTFSDDVYTKSMISTEEVKNMSGSVITNKTQQKTQPMEDTTINDIIEKVKQTVKPIEDRENIQMMSPKLAGCTQSLKTSKPNSMPTDDYLGLQKFKIEPKESSIMPDIDYTGVKEMNTENDKAEMPESVNLMEENESYISSRNKVESVENVPGSCKGNLEITFEKSQFPVTKNNSSVPNHVGHVAFNSFNELKTELNKETTRAISSLSENYQPDAVSSKNEAKTDFVNEAAENSDALKTEKLKPIALPRTRRRKINDCSSAVYTKTIQRLTKNRSTSANCEQIIERSDNHTELNSLHKSESNYTTGATKLSQRARPKKQHVETNGNIESDNINHTQELEKPLKETVEKQPADRRKAATKRKGKTVTNTVLEENGPVQENESDLTAKIWLRSRNGKKSASDLKTMFAKGKTNDTMSGEESNKRRKIAAIQSSPETFITTLNEDKQGGQKCTIPKICKTEASENNLTAMEENLVETKKKKKVHFFLKNDFKASEEKYTLGYEGNTYKEEESQTENICHRIPKVPLESMQTSAEPSLPRIEKLSKKNLSSRGKKSVSSPSVESDSKSDVKDHDVVVSLKENQPKRGRGRKIVQVFPKFISLENNTFGEEDSTMNKCPLSQGRCSLPQVQNENFEKSEMLPLENVQSCEGPIPPKRVVKGNPSRRGRSKQVNETSGNEEADVQGPNIATRQEDNQSKRGRGKRNAQESCLLKSQKVVKESPPRRGKHKKPISGDKSTDFDSPQIATILDQNTDGKNACLAKDDQSKVSRRTRNTVVSQKSPSVKNDTCHLLSSNKGEHSDEHPSEDLKSANNAKENFAYKCRKGKTVHEISANSISSSKKPEFIDNDVQENGKKDSKAVSKQSTSRSRRKRIMPCETSAESNDELRINSKKSQPVVDIVGPLENSFGKKPQSKKQKEETNIVSLISPSLKVSITLSPLSSATENQSGNCKNSIRTRKLAKLSGTCSIMTRSLKGKRIISKEEFVHETQDLQKTVMATVINQRRGRRKINKLEAAVSPLKEKLTLSAGSDNSPNEQTLNNVSNNKISSKGKGPKFLEIKNMTQNINQSNSSNYDQNKNLKPSNMLVQKSSSERAKRKINNSETITTVNMVKSVIPGKKSTISKTENTESITVQTRGKKKMKGENTILMTELPRKTESRTRASKRIRK